MWSVRQELNFISLTCGKMIKKIPRSRKMAVSQHGQILLYTRLGEYYLFLTPAFKIQHILSFFIKQVRLLVIKTLSWNYSFISGWSSGFSNWHPFQWHEGLLRPKEILGSYIRGNRRKTNIHLIFLCCHLVARIFLNYRNQSWVSFGLNAWLRVIFRNLPKCSLLNPSLWNFPSDFIRS